MKRLGFIGPALVLLFVTATDASVLQLEGFRFDVYTSFEYEYQLESEGNGDPNGSFDTDQIDLAFHYETGEFRFALDLVIEHGVATEDNLGNIELSFGLVEYMFGDGFKLRAGKFFTPFGIHNELLTVRSSFLTVKEPWAANKPSKLTENGYRFFPRRQVGLGALGSSATEKGLIEYDVTVSNGAQEDTNPFEEDNNPQKALTGRFNFYPGDGNFLVGVSTYFDRLGAGEEAADQSSIGLHADYTGKRWTLRGEWLTGEIDPDLGFAVKQQGAYIDLGYQWGRFTPYVEYQNIEVEIDDRSETGEAWIAGLFLKLGHTGVIKIENGYFQGSDDNPKFDDIPGRDYNEVKLAFVIGF